MRVSMKGSGRAYIITDCSFKTQTILWILSDCNLQTGKMVMCWCCVFLLIVTSFDKYMLFPDESASTSQKMLAVSALRSSILICMKSLGQGIYYMYMCWVVLIKPAVENLNSTPTQPQANGNSFPTMSSIIYWVTLLTIYVPVVAWVRRKHNASVLAKEDWFLFTAYAYIKDLVICWWGYWVFFSCY